MPKSLVIDDEQDVVIFIKKLVEYLLPDSKVFTALSGQEELEIAPKEQPDAIMLDIVMSEMNGYEVCTRLKNTESTAQIPIIMLTGIESDTKDKIKSLQKRSNRDRCQR